jgi:hypothetical protein
MASSIDLLWTAEVDESGCSVHAVGPDSLVDASLRAAGFGSTTFPLLVSVWELHHGGVHTEHMLGYCCVSRARGGLVTELIKPFEQFKTLTRVVAAFQPTRDGSVSLVLDTADQAPRRSHVRPLALAELQISPGSDHPTEPLSIDALKHWHIGGSFDLGVLRMRSEAIVVDTAQQLILKVLNTVDGNLDVVFADSAPCVALAFDTSSNPQRAEAVVLRREGPLVTELGRLTDLETGAARIVHFDDRGEALYCQVGSGPVHVWTLAGEAQQLSPGTRVLDAPGLIWQVSKDGRRMLLVLERLALCQVGANSIDIIWQRSIEYPCMGCTLSDDGEYVAQFSREERRITIFAPDGAVIAEHTDALLDAELVGTAFRLHSDGRGGHFLIGGVGLHSHRLPARVVAYHFEP